jgi:hypothetical protein
MNRIFKTARLAAVSLALAAGSAGVVAAQEGGGTTGGGTTGGGATNRTTTSDTRTDRGFDWGWLGLLGLAGLIPLFTRNNGDGRFGNTSSNSSGTR